MSLSVSKQAFDVQMVVLAMILDYQPCKDSNLSKRRLMHIKTLIKISIKTSVLLINSSMQVLFGILQNSI